MAKGNEQEEEHKKNQQQKGNQATKLSFAVI